MMEKLKGQSIPQLIALGHTKFASMPSGGSGASAPAASAKVETKKVEEKAPVKEEEADVDMGDLFGGDY